MIDLTGGPCIYKRISGCGSGTEYMAVTPWGDLYPCHQFVGDEKYKLGDIFDSRCFSNTKIQDEFKLCNAYARPDCKDCWARLYCSGGCAANAYHATGSITPASSPPRKASGCTPAVRPSWNPVFGQMSTLQNAKHLLLRGFEQARAEWLLLAACHNLRKLHGHIGIAGLSALPAQ